MILTLHTQSGAHEKNSAVFFFFFFHGLLTQYRDDIDFAHNLEMILALNKHSIKIYCILALQTQYSDDIDSVDTVQ